ncbi:MAG: hypothetical protein CFE24_05170 [Flavobacterium sp. BFFFF2]|nr:MAG: hypothetical protein CFE24_05170 [Flavobacterium sp. BFFFF2]
MALIENFSIKPMGAISKALLEMNIFNFQQATDFIKQLPYGRNVDKENLVSVLSDGCGTCSSKHALLKQLAIENQFYTVKLFVGLFKMGSKNRPAIAATLEKYKLAYIPEAHCYLKLGNEIIDVTKTDANPDHFMPDLIEEMEIQPHQITSFKVDYHKNYMAHWLRENREIMYTPDEMWAIREQCIQDLATP